MYRAMHRVAYSDIQSDAQGDTQSDTQSDAQGVAQGDTQSDAQGDTQGDQGPLRGQLCATNPSSGFWLHVGQPEPAAWVGPNSSPDLQDSQDRLLGKLYMHKLEVGEAVHVQATWGSEGAADAE